jgi:hypothetical protein
MAGTIMMAEDGLFRVVMALMSEWPEDEEGGDAKGDDDDFQRQA